MRPHELLCDSGGSHLMELAVNVNGNGNLTSPFPSSAVFPTTLKFEEVVYKVKTGNGKEKTVLNGVTGMVCPGEMLAMLGPSGSGKTTLLTALGGRLPAKNLSGKITYNGLPFSAAARRRTGFVSQDDVLYPHLTVTETLMFTALLRLPGSLTRAEKVEKARRVVGELGLGRVAESVVGGPRVRGISGGEKRRVSIGLEMLLNPSLLLLDEPTSGLDSTSAEKIVGMLRRLAVDDRRAVAVTIHQPSSKLYYMFDKVILLSEGSPIYHGRAVDALGYFGSLGFAAVGLVNPAELLLDLANGISPDSKLDHNKPNADDGDHDRDRGAVRDKLTSAYDHNIAARLKAELFGADMAIHCISHNPLSAGLRKAGKTEQWTTTWCEQFIVLLHRSLKERRHEAFNKLRIFQVLSVAILGGLLWWQTPPSHLQDKTALIFFFSVFWGFFPLYNAVFTFPQERPILLKERASGMYRLSAYFLARTVGDLPIELLLPTAFTFIIYFMGGLDPHPPTFLLSLLIVLYSVLVAQSLGLAFGAILMDVKQATTLASVTTLTFLIAGGYYVQHIPIFILWLKYLSYSFYCFKLLIGVQFKAGDSYECGNGGKCSVLNFPVIKSVGLGLLWVDVLIMGLMLVGYRLIAYWALHRLQRPR